MRKLLALTVVLAVTAGTSAQQPPKPTPQAKVTRPKRPRGAIATPRHKVFAAKHYTPKIKAPASFVPWGTGQVPALSYWLNDQYGDCVTAEEMAKLAFYSVTCGLPEVLVSDSVTQQWARSNGYLNGADLSDVLDTMASQGITFNGVTYKDGEKATVDYSSYTTVTAAIAETQGPVKIGVAADQLDNTVGTTNGWIATGYGRDQNEDHSIGLVGYGTMTQLCAALGVAAPADAVNYTQCYLVFTWSTVGIMDHASMVAITGEAWSRTPPTVGESPTPLPSPAPTGLTYALTGTIPAGASIDGSGNFTWPNPTAGLATITFTVSAGSSPATGTLTVQVMPAGTSSIVVNPIPVQSATAGVPFTFRLSDYVTTSPAAGHK